LPQLDRSGSNADFRGSYVEPVRTVRTLERKEKLTTCGLLVRVSALRVVINIITGNIVKRARYLLKRRRGKKAGDLEFIRGGNW
jgi:hypothetical protein